MFLFLHGYWELKRGKAAYEQCHKPIVCEKSWESLQWAQPLTTAECLCVCLKYTCYKHRSAKKPKPLVTFRSLYLCLGPDLCLKDFLELRTDVLTPWLPLGDRVQARERALWRLNYTSSGAHPRQKSSSAGAEGQEIRSSCTEAWSHVRRRCPAPAVLREAGLWGDAGPSPARDVTASAALAGRTKP